MPTVATVVEKNNRFLMVEERADGEVVFNQPAGHLEPGETLLEAAAGGLGLFLAPAWLASECTGEIRLVRVLPDWIGPSLPIHAVWSSGKLRGKAKLFIDHAEPSITAACGLSRLEVARA